MILIDDIADYLEDLEIGIVGTTIFKSYMPPTPDNCIAVLDTGGVEPDHDLPTKHPTFQVLVRSTDYATGKALLDSIRAGLHQAKGELISGQTFFYYVFALSEGGHIGRNDRGLDEFSINFECLTR